MAIVGHFMGRIIWLISIVALWIYAVAFYSTALADGDWVRMLGQAGILAILWFAVDRVVQGNGRLG